MNPAPHRPPVALGTIALFEIVKGILALIAAYGLISLRHTDLHAAADELLLRHGIDPETHFRRLFIESVAKATHYPVSKIAAFACAYAFIRFAEGLGLWFEKRWAEWFTVLSVGLYLPLELGHLVHHPSALTSAIILLNILLIIYLGNLLIHNRHSRKCPSIDQTP